MTAPAEVLWLSPELGPDARAGGQIRTTRLLQALGRHATVDVVAVQPWTIDSHVTAQRANARTVITARRRHPVGARLLAVRHGWPIAGGALWRGDIASLVRRRSAAGAVVVLDHEAMLVYGRDAERAVVLLHNIESQRVPENGSASRRPDRGWERRRYRRLESRLAPGSGPLAVTVSERDARSIGHGIVVPNGADLPATPPPLDPDGPALFVGALDYRPNAEALRWFVERVAPHLGRGRLPLQVVGRAASALPADLARHPALDVVGEVDDVGPYLGAAGIVVAPLREGGGTRLKVVEALAWGRPVVTTTKGAEGLELVAGRDALFADDAPSFAAAMELLATDHACARRMAAAGRRAVQPYSWDVIGAAFAGAVLARAEPWRRGSRGRVG